MALKLSYCSITFFCFHLFFCSGFDVSSAPTRSDKRCSYEQCSYDLASAFVPIYLYELIQLWLLDLTFWYWHSSAGFSPQIVFEARNFSNATVFQPTFLFLFLFACKNFLLILLSLIMMPRLESWGYSPMVWQRKKKEDKGERRNYLVHFD